VRTWDLAPSKLCDKHLLAEHRDVHAIWAQLVNYPEILRNLDPEIYRWRGREAALYVRHGELLEEMVERKFRHNSRLQGTLIDLGSLEPPTPLLSIERQVQKLAQKCSGCRKRLGLPSGILF
jgi:hypothetical protein